MSKAIPDWRICAFLLLALLLPGACSPAEPSAPAATVAPTATTTPFPTFAFVQPTLAPNVAAGATAAAATLAADSGFVLDMQKAEYGLGRWEFLECGSCHGADGSGDIGPSLLDYSASEADFADTLRTGGAAGSTHRYPAERLSNSGVSNLYHYVRSLGSAG